MADMETSGLRLMADVGDFINKMGAAADAVSKMGNMTKNRLAAMELFNNAAVKMAGVGSNIADSYSKVAISANKLAESENNLAIRQKGISSTAVESGFSIGQLASTIFGATVASQLFVNILGAIKNGLTYVAREALKAVAEFQRYNIVLEGLIARDIAKQQVIPFGEALEKAIGPAKELSNWVKTLAVQTPFTIEEVMRVFTMSAAMQFTATQSKALTKSVIDFAAGMGVTGDQVWRIIYALSQMKQAGRVLQTELRQLSESFVPVVDVLTIVGNKFKITWREAREELRLGTIPVQEFMEAFNQMASVYEGAGQRLTRTLTGVIDKAKDLVQAILGANILKPMFDRITGSLSDTLNVLISPAAMRASEFIGMSLGQAFDIIAPAATSLFKSVKDLIGVFINLGKAVSPIGRLFDEIGKSLNITDYWINEITASSKKYVGVGTYVNQLTDEQQDKVNILSSWWGKLAVGITYAAEIIRFAADKVAGFLGGIAKGISDTIGPLATQVGDWLYQAIGLPAKKTGEDAIQWGIDLVTNFAAGMIQAAASVLTTATQWLASILTNWLAPGSAPKFLPDLLSWGAGAFTEYLRGFSLADFTVLDSVQGALQGALNALVDLGALAKEDIGGIFTDISKEIAKAIADFEITGAFDPSIYAKLAEVGGGFGEELAELFRRQIALADATKKAELAQKAYNDAIEKSKQSRVAVNKSIKEYNAMLRTGATQKELDAKLKEVNAMELSADAAFKDEEAKKAAAEEAQKGLDVYKEQVQLQEKLIAQLIELAKAQAEAQKAVAAAGAEQPPIPEIELPEPPGGVGGIGTALDKLLEEIRKKVQEKLAGIWDDLVTSWQEKVNPALDNLKIAWGSFTTTLWSYWDWFALRLNLPSSESIMSAWSGFDGTWSHFVINLMKTWDLFATHLGLPTTNKISEGLADLPKTIGGIFSKIGQVVSGIFGPMVTAIGGWFAFFGPMFEKAFGAILPALQNLGKALTDLWTLVSPALITLGKWFLITFVGALQIAGKAIAGFIGPLIAGIGWVIAGIINIVSGIINVIIGLIRLVYAYFTMSTEDAKKALNDIWEGIKQIFVGTLETILGVVIGVFGSIIGFFVSWGKAIWDFFVDLYNKLVGKSIIWDIVNGIWNAITTVIGAVKTWLETTWDSIKQKIVDTWDAVKQKVSDTVDAVKSYIETWIGILKTWWDITWTSIRDKIVEMWSGENGIWTKIKKVVDDLIDLISNPTTGLGAKFLKLKDDVLSKVKEAFDNIGKAISGVITWIGELIKAIFSLDIGKILSLLGIKTSKNTTDEEDILPGSSPLKDYISIHQNKVSAPLVSAGARFTIGPNYISNGMDEAMFEQKVRLVVGSMI